MKLPFVARETYDAMLADRRAECASWKAEVESAHARYDTLLDKYHALKVVGGSVQETRAAVAPAPPDPVIAAILSKANGNRALVAYYTSGAGAQWIHEQRENAVPLDDIAAAIRHGVDDDQGVPA